MATNKELEKRIEILENEVQHLKAILQYQMRNKKKWVIKVAWFQLWPVYFLIVRFKETLESGNIINAT